jgi:Mn2+/Fe2+ NRAMP family transporter
MASPSSPGLLARLWRGLGPGLITGAADDDPSGIATYSQAGAQFGYRLSWSLFFTVPLMAAVQIICARIGAQSGRGLASALAHAFPRRIVLVLVALLAAANTLNIAADVAAMGAALRLVIGGPAVIYAVGFGLVCLVAEIYLPYHRYAVYLKFLTLLLLVYVVAAFSVHVPWGRVMGSMLLPHLSMQRQELLMLVAVLGTTISPYLFFWQASQEAEEARLNHRQHAPDGARDISVDTWIGMLFSNVIGFFIIVTTAAALGAHGITKIETAEQAAEALRPLAGELTFLLFACGIISTGLLAVPVLAGSAAYAIAETFHLRGSLELPAHRARAFYALIAVATLGGSALALTRVNVVALLFWTAVVNGIVAVPIMLAMMLLVSMREGRRRFQISLSVRALGWMALLVMAAASALFLGSSLL